ncbi:MAG: isocitrate/isopropylmalate dehydrogenase family protein, partial [Clostridia bacterium]|nr:isocitrate/isopropylmalate dehydrogenase family protein [Clostridia bacterium]
MYDITSAVAHYEKVLRSQLERLDRIKSEGDFVDFDSLPVLRIGVCGGDGIGPSITREAARVLAYLLEEEIQAGKVELVEIDGLTIENRAACGKAIPDDVMEVIKTCPVILKGPTTTPKAGDPWPNIESANVAMRKALDLFANVRPVKVADKGIDWRFFRENTEGGYAVGSLGSNVTDEMAVDFTIATTEGCERICRLAFEYAKNNGRKRVTCVTKANIIKATDGKFLRIFYDMAKEYPDIQVDDWFIDIMTAKLVDEKRRTQFDVFVMPNLYGDILTDEAAEFQGGVGTAGSANIGKKYAMFEAIHGSAPRMVEEGRDIYADPCSMIRAVVMLLEHIGKQEKAVRLANALDFCTTGEGAMTITGRADGATTAAFADYLISK